MQSPPPKPPSPARALVVSLHDVSVWNYRKCEEILSDLADAGVPVTSLLVIPDHHRRGRSFASEEFLKWLKDKEKAGHEVVLHGYYHLRLTRRSKHVVDELIASHYTAGEGEFFDISEDEAAGLLTRGMEEFRQAGFFPSGFVAPAWLLGEAAERAVRQAGFRYTTRIGYVWDLKNQSKIRSRSLVYSVRSGWRRRMSLVWNETLHRVVQSNPLARLGLHPPDWEHPEIKNHIFAILRRVLADRCVMTYDGWLDSREVLPEE